MNIIIYDKDSKPETEHYFSVSQIKLWKTCKVCYAARYLDKIEQAPNAAAQRGIDIHKLLEDYLREGKPIDPSSKYGRIALAGLPYLPKPGTCEVEDKFVFSYDGIFFRGIIDFYYQRDDLWVVADHKTTGSFKNAIHQSMLNKDLQAALYGFYIMNKFKVDQAELNWVYYLTKGAPASRLVSGKLNLTEATESVTLVLSDCNEILDAKRKGLSAMDFSPPAEGCKGFGPCAAQMLGIRRNPVMSEKKSLKDFLATKVEEQPVKAAEKPQDPVLAAPEPEPEPQPTPEAPKRTKLDSGEGWTLLIDCLPQKGNQAVLELGDLLKHVFRMIAKDYSVAHHSFIPYEARGAFITRLDKYLTDHPIPSGTVVLMSMSSPDARDSLDVLINHAARVYRACR